MCFQVLTYFCRELLTPILLIIATLWPLFLHQNLKQTSKFVIAAWVVFAVLLSGFTVLPVEKADRIELVCIGGALIGVFAIAAGRVVRQLESAKQKNESRIAGVLDAVQVSILLPYWVEKS